MQRINNIVVPVVTMFLLFGVSALPADDTAGDEPQIEITFVIEPLTDLFMLVRSLAEQPDAEVPEEMQRAVEIARGLQGDLRHPRAWTQLTAALDGCKDSDELVARYEALPAEMHTPGRDEPVALRERAGAFADALREAEPFFREAHWKQHKALLEQAASELRELLDGEARSWDQYVLEHLQMKNPQHSVNVLLTVDGPHPGAVTYRNARGKVVCFVALSSSKGTQRLETVIHEVIHAFDATTTDEPTALTQMRSALRDEGIRWTDPFMRDLPHVLIFLQAAHTVRALVDPEHEDYGISSGVYEWMGEPATIAQQRWNDYIRGERDLPATIELIVNESIASRTEEP